MNNLIDRLDPGKIVTAFRKLIPNIMSVVNIPAQKPPMTTSISFFPPLEDIVTEARNVITARRQELKPVSRPVISTIRGDSSKGVTFSPYSSTQGRVPLTEITGAFSIASISIFLVIQHPHSNRNRR
ncbi:hypothetical protein [Methanococcoides burtonii]|uniref:hypothetical protein n=1 Tax=Methanococcoides burtonii TaxID=29291 RepID=UPI001E5CFBCF|nr:hypothetical protein [Methanococcoides burtonii]